MKEYLLLRANTESGPYRLEELKALPLRPRDLVWVTGESARWEDVSERSELSGLVVPEPRRAAPQTARALPETGEPLPVAPEIPVRTRQPHPFRFAAGRRSNAGGFWIVALFGCLVISAVVVKKIIENGTAVTQGAALALATGTLPERPEGQGADAPAGFQYQNALKRETLGHPAPEGFRNVSLRELRRLVTLSTNTDKEGVFDGINDVQIRVSNGSGQELEQVNIEVTFLHPNGAFWHRENYSVSGLRPHGDKILVVAPPVKRGARVKYRLTGVAPKAPEQTPA
ncbi:MAG: hypothetical protein EOO12_06420 [Chitinophagaceae bacterium]|nr:MAG: hypothetical protein EOO12_06420 [Chitinophagaceae bacterium]